MANNTQALERVNKHLKEREDKLKQFIKGPIDPRSIIRFALVEVAKSPQLQQCDPQSLYMALVAAASVGLEPSGVRGEAYIVPFREKGQYVAVFMPGYRGLIKLMKNSGQVRHVTAEVVYEQDSFEVEKGSSPRIVHRPAMRDRGDIVAAYAIAWMRDGTQDFEVVPVEDLEKIRASAKRGDKESPAYRDWEDQMYRKAPIRRLSKRMPLGHDYFLAQRMAEAVEVGDMSMYRATVDPEIGSPTGLSKPPIDTTAEEAPTPKTSGEAPAEPPAEDTGDDLRAAIRDAPTIDDLNAVARDVPDHLRSALADDLEQRRQELSGEAA